MINLSLLEFTNNYNKKVGKPFYENIFEVKSTIGIYIVRFRVNLPIVRSCRPSSAMELAANQSKTVSQSGTAQAFNATAPYHICLKLRRL